MDYCIGNLIYKSFLDVITVMLNNLKRGFVALFVLVMFAVIMSGCGRPDVGACIPDPDDLTCPKVNCPFGECFQGDFVKQVFVSGKVHVLGISNQACSELFEEEYGTNKHLCKLLQAEQIYKVGNTPEGERWEWSIDCECSYEK